MVRKTGTVLAIALVLATVLANSGLPLSAQDPQRGTRTGNAGVFGEGISELILARYATDGAPTTVDALTFERLTVEPGAHSDWRELSAPELLLAETGTVIIADQFGFEGRLSEGQSLLLRSGSSYAIVGTDATAMLLRLRLASAVETPATTPEPPAPAETPLASPVASPMASPIIATPEAEAEVAIEPPAATIETTVLLESRSFELPSSSADLFITLLEYAPGADTGDYTHAGPLGLLVASGALDVTSPSGLSAQLPAGRGVILPAGSAHREQNLGDEPATAWVVGIVPPGVPLIEPILPTPTPTPEPTSTPVPTNTPVPTPTVEPSPTPEPTSTPVPSPTPEPTSTPISVPAGTVLYEANSDGGFEEWELPADWVLFNGLLANVGTVATTAIQAPFVPPTSEYAVEVEIQVAQWDSECDWQTPESGSEYGVRARASGDEHVGGSIGVGYSSSTGLCHWYPYIVMDGSRVFAGSREGLSISGRSTDGNFVTSWHQLRLEVQGNTARLFIDGVEVAVYANNRLIGGDPGRVEIYATSENQVVVRSVRIIAL